MPQTENNKRLRIFVKVLAGDKQARDDNFEMIAKTSPRNRVIMLLMRDRDKDNEEALQLCNDSLNPNDPVSLYLTAVCYNRMENSEKAEEVLYKAIRMRPDLENAARYDGDLSQLPMFKEAWETLFMTREEIEERERKEMARFMKEIENIDLSLTFEGYKAKVKADEEAEKARIQAEKEAAAKAEAEIRLKAEAKAAKEAAKKAKKKGKVASLPTDSVMQLTDSMSLATATDSLLVSAEKTVLAVQDSLNTVVDSLENKAEEVSKKAKKAKAKKNKKKKSKKQSEEAPVATSETPLNKAEEEMDVTKKTDDDSAEVGKMETSVPENTSENEDEKTADGKWHGRRKYPMDLPSLLS